MESSSRGARAPSRAVGEAATVFPIGGSDGGGDGGDRDGGDGEAAEFADERLRLIFICCHPALSMQARVALTLRTLTGMSTAQIARAFLTGEPTMAKRLVRAKHKIRDAGIPYRVPPAHLLAERTGGVLAVIYLLFNEGYSAAAGGEPTRRDLAAQALQLARALSGLMPDEPEALGLLALLCFQDARREARRGRGELPRRAAGRGRGFRRCHRGRTPLSPRPTRRGRRVRSTVKNENSERGTLKMKYMLIHYIDEALLDAWESGEVETGPEEIRGLTEWDEEVDRRGILLGGGHLKVPRTSTALRVRDGEVLVTDGPFAETKEQIAGYSVLECADPHQAIKIASRHPTARFGTFELRPYEGVSL